MMIRIIWPERRTVSKDTIIGWARDEMVNAGAPENMADPTLEEAIHILSDSGSVTFRKF